MTTEGTSYTEYKWEDFCVTGLSILAEKNKLYGDSIQETGLLGAVVECIAKVARLRMMVLKHPGHGRDFYNEIEDTLLDLHNYSVIALEMLAKGNWEGR